MADPTHHLYFEGAPCEVELPGGGNGLHFRGPVPRVGETLHLPGTPSSANHWLGVWRVDRVAWRWLAHSGTTSADVHLRWEDTRKAASAMRVAALEERTCPPHRWGEWVEGRPSSSQGGAEGVSHRLCLEPKCEVIDFDYATAGK